MSIKRLKIPLVHLVVFAVIYGFLLSYFTPSHLLSKTVPTGGDTASHYLTADYLINTLLPSRKIIGWMPGNYAGFPMFQFYFPFPFLLMAALNLFVPLQIAFKLVTVLGVFLLPLSAFLCLRLLGFAFPGPLTGAVFSLPFLFMEANSMWGGNIPSTLAGEFAYGIALALLVLYLGLFYKGVAENKYGVRNAVLLTVIGLCHGYALLFGVFATLFFVFTTHGFIQKTWYYLKVNGIAFLLLGFWMIQLLWFMPYTTRFNFVWILKGIFQVFPPILLPGIALAGAGAALNLVRAIRRRPAGEGRGAFYQEGLTSNSNGHEKAPSGRGFLWFICLLAAAFYLVAYNLDVVDIRFIPFIQFSLMLLAAVGLCDLLSGLRGQFIMPVLLSVVTILFVNIQVSYIPSWVAWNYSGFENKRVWERFKAVQDYLKGTCQDPRVAYEHDPKHEQAGSIRAFEMLPYFSGRSTLEGLYIQSTVTSPFVFYVQSEISQRPSTPLPDYNYSRLNMKRGIEHLRLFNVSHLIVVTDRLRETLKTCQDLVREAHFPPYSVYRVRGNVDRYVSVLKNEPLLLITKKWRSEAFQWFRKSDLSTLVAFREELKPVDTSRFSKILQGNLPEELIRGGSRLEETDAVQDGVVDVTESLQETVRPEEILFQTKALGRPHLVRVSYHPNWHVEGAEGIYPVSPSFMLIFPTQEQVRLYFGPSFPNYLGYFLTLLGLAVGLSHVVWQSRSAQVESAILNWAQARLGGRFYDPALRRKLLRGLVLTVVCITLASVLLVHQDDAITAYTRGFSYYERGDYDKAREIFQEAMREFPSSPVIDQTAFHHAASYFKEKKWEQALEGFEKMAADFPESRMFSEVLYHIGICKLKQDRRQEAVAIFRRIVREFPGDRWAMFAKERLGEVERM